MLEKIRLKNFKLHEDTSIEAGRITVFIGPNNSGKSSIFQALLLIRQAASRNDQFLCQPSTNYRRPESDPFEYNAQLAVDVGEFDDIVRRTGEDFYFEFSGTVQARKPPSGLDHVRMSAQLRVRENRLVSHCGSIKYSGTQTSWDFIEGTAPRNEAIILGRVTFFLRPVNSFGLTAPGGYSLPDPPPPRDEALPYNDISVWIGGIASNLLMSVHPVYALRGFEEWGYPITDYAPASLELMTLHDRALALPNALAADRRLKKRLSDQLQELLRISIDFETVPGKRLKIWARPSHEEARETPYVNEGSGANQIPFVLVPVLLAPQNETVLLCEPEAHLHPRAQSELTNLLLRVAGKQNLQFFIETHSEHVLHRLLHAVAKAELPKEELALYYFVNEDGRAKATRLTVNEHGQVDGGLPGFYDQSLDELSEYLDALRKH